MILTIEIISWTISSIRNAVRSGVLVTLLTGHCRLQVQSWFFRPNLAFRLKRRVEYYFSLRNCIISHLNKLRSCIFCFFALMQFSVIFLEYLGIVALTHEKWDFVFHTPCGYIPVCTCQLLELVLMYDSFPHVLKCKPHLKLGISKL